MITLKGVKEMIVLNAYDPDNYPKDPIVNEKTYRDIAAKLDSFIRNTEPRSGVTWSSNISVPNSIFTKELIEVKGKYKITDTCDWKLSMIKIGTTPCILFLRQSMKLHKSPADRWETMIALVPENMDEKTRQELYYDYDVKNSTSKVSVFISKAENILY